MDIDPKSAESMYRMVKSRLSCTNPRCSKGKSQATCQANSRSSLLEHKQSDIANEVGKRVDDLERKTRGTN
jgi:hypothetical protein